MTKARKITDLKGWHDVDKKLPKDGQEVLATCLHKYQNSVWKFGGVDLLTFKKNSLDGNSFMDGSHSCSVSHWHKLPPLPKLGKK